MSMFSCFTVMAGKRKKDKEDKPVSYAGDYYEKLKTLQAKNAHGAKPIETDESKLMSYKISVNPSANMKVMSHESPIDLAYEGENEQEENLSTKKNDSDFDFQPHIVESSEENYPSTMKNIESNYSLSNISDKDDFGFAQSGHVSDPGIKKQHFWASPNLVRSCSFVETNEVLKNLAYKLPSSKDKSFEELNRLAEKMDSQVLHSPKSVTSHQSADRVILKKHSSSQILPSRSRKLWWKLFLWSHRNMPKPMSKTRSFPNAMNQQGGYCSDNLDPNGALGSTKGNDENTLPWEGVSGFWPQNQWVALTVESPLPRVYQWVQELANQPIIPVDNDVDENTGIIDYPPSPEGKNVAHLNRRTNLNVSEEIMHANGVIQSLNLSSTVAHIAGVGLRVIPTLSNFSSLRSVNLSGNSIANVTSGSLPKGLHTLNLSRNKITVIGGFRQLTRLRVLDLSYNKISRIGHGLSNCTLIKELYLAGNKISEVEGLHRLLKLSLLDLSFNKISTTKALGQLVANYNTLLALNLLGDPIQNNISDDQLRKSVCGLLPKLAFLNKQPVNSHKAREVATESIAKAALGNSDWSSRKRGVRKASHGRSGHRSSASIGQASSRQSVRGRALRK